MRNVLLCDPDCHDECVAKELKIDLSQPLLEKGSIVIVPVAGIHRVVAESISFAKTMSPNVVAFYIANSEEKARKMEDRWEQWHVEVRLVVFVSRYRSMIKPRMYRQWHLLH